ncbi:MAG TPA: hypothetical protein PK707_04525 [Candidatus Syntrophosphaera thermopropionivorans]|jgi:hypothetical protein|nr:hypothetical protein [Candidatus Syntrophosphaera thermopropionivorans]HQF82100.1 hypothetical protein [Candidatus Syntrophosphaera thermopropionivorans]
MKKIGILLLLIIISLCACDTNSTKPDEEEIRNIIYDISRDFCWNDINGIMEYVHKDFRHNGMYRDELRLLWNERRNKYQLLQCDISQIYIHNEYATVFMTMTYQSATETVTFLEPDTFGDASYYYFDKGRWQIYGNQEWKINKIRGR